MNKLFSIVFIAISFPTLCQNTFQAGTSRIEFRVRAEDKEIDYKGSPYVSDEFKKATVNDISGVYLLRYNAADGIFEFREDKLNSQVWVLPKKEDATVTFDETGKKYIKLNDYPGYGNGFYVLEVDKPNYQFLVKEVVEFIPEVVSSDTYTKSTPPTYKRKDDEYFLILKESKEVIRIPQRKAKFKNTFAEYTKDSKLLKSIDPSKIEELKVFFQKIFD